MHGTPPPGDRLRVYVGSDHNKIAAARAAMTREAERCELEAQMAKTGHSLSSCGYHLRSFYGLLGYRVGEDGRPEPR